MKYEKIDYIWQKKHLRKFVLGMTTFGLMIALTIVIGKKIEAGIFVNVIMAMLPVIPFVIAMSAYIDNIKSMDEMWKKIQSDALIMTALITIIFCLSFGMLQVMNVIDTFSIFYVFILIVIIWSFSFAYVAYKINGLKENEK